MKLCSLHDGLADGVSRRLKQGISIVDDPGSAEANTANRRFAKSASNRSPTARSSSARSVTHRIIATVGITSALARSMDATARSA